MELYYRAIIDLCKKYLGSFIMLCERTFVLCTLLPKSDYSFSCELRIAWCNSPPYNML